MNRQSRPKKDESIPPLFQSPDQKEDTPKTPPSSPAPLKLLKTQDRQAAQAPADCTPVPPSSDLVDEIDLEIPLNSDEKPLNSDENPLISDAEALKNDEIPQISDEILLENDNNEASSDNAKPSVELPLISDEIPKNSENTEPTSDDYLLLSTCVTIPPCGNLEPFCLSAFT